MGTGYQQRAAWNTTVASGAPVIVWGINAINAAGDSGQLLDGTALGAQIEQFDFAANDGTFIWDFGIPFPNGCYVSLGAGTPATVFYTKI